MKKYADKFSEYAPLQEEDLISAVSSTREDSGGFRRVIEQVLSDQKVKSEAVPGKVGAFMGQMYPIAGFVLGIVSFGADVGSSYSRLESCNANVRTGYRSSSAENNCQRRQHGTHRKLSLGLREGGREKVAN